jgi:hypothetical protein
MVRVVFFDGDNPLSTACYVRGRLKADQPTGIVGCFFPGLTRLEDCQLPPIAGRFLVKKHGTTQLEIQSSGTQLGLAKYEDKREVLVEIISTATAIHCVNRLKLE